jgi:aspartate ammonia-lyase
VRRGPLVSKRRTEHDFLGEAVLPGQVLYGIHTHRAGEFLHRGSAVQPALVRHLALWLACATTNRAVSAGADSASRGCRTGWSIGGGGGAGEHQYERNEVLANRALQLLGLPPAYERISLPMISISTNRPTTLIPRRCARAAIGLIKELEQQIVLLREAFGQGQEFAHVVKVGRTQLQDA